MFALKLLAALIYAASPSTALNCADGRKCVYMKDCNGELKEGCPLAYSYKLEGDVLSMELAGYQPSGSGRYLAIGFNENSGMSNARVTECSAIGDEKFPSVKLSWNKDPGTANVRIEDEETFRNQIISEAVGKYSDGLMYCSWKQKVGAFNNEKVFQLKAGLKYHHIVAYGETQADPPKLNKHPNNGAQPTVFDTFDGTPGLDCSDGRSCVYKEECEGELKKGCTIAYSYKLDGENLIMELAGYQPSGTGRYIAIGFNEDDVMSNARVTECSAIGDEKTPSVKLSWNKSPGTANVRIDGEETFRDQIITSPVAKYESGMIYCSWTQNVGKFNNDKVFQLEAGVKYHHLIAYGETSSNPDTLKKHPEGGAQKTVYATFDGSDSPDDPGNTSGDGLDCEGGRTCVYMKSCNKKFDSKCPLAYSFKLDGDILSMELAGYQKTGMKRYLAVGFGEKDGMGESKVTECSAIGDEQFPTVKLSYNTPGDESVNVRIDNEPNIRSSIISDAVSRYNEGMIYCSWKQNVSANNYDDKVFQWKDGVMYYHICAYGPTAVDADYAGLDQHDDFDKPLKTDFKGTSDTGDSTNTKLLKAHGSLMMIAWLIFVPIAAVFARFLRAHWPTKKPFGLALWFHVHRTSNIVACLVIIAGFVCVFIETGWNWRGIGSGSSYWVVTHSTVGIIACVLAWLQPFISLLRCDPQNPRRPVFNWIHRLIGVTAFLLAVTAVSIAGNNFSIWTDHLTYLILSLVPLGAVIVLFVIMTILDAKVRVHDANIVKIHAIRFTLVCITIAIAVGAAVALVVMLCLS